VPKIAEVTNRFNLFLSAQESFLARQRARSQPSVLRRSTVQTPGATAAESTTAAPGFSVLNRHRNNPHRKTPAQLDADEAEFADLRAGSALAPNAGTGYAPSAASASAAAVVGEDRMLRGRLLGKRARGGQAEVGRKLAESSDEEEGRSALGRRKRLAGAGTQNGTKLSDAEEGNAGKRNGRSDEVVTATPAEQDALVQVPSPESKPANIGEGQQELPNRSKRKKNKKKKSKRKGAKGDATN